MANSTLPNAVFDQELYARCYRKTASKWQWRNRTDYDSIFEAEVETLYNKIRKFLAIT